MNGSRLERLAPLSGVGFVAATIASTVLIGFYEYLPDPGTIRDHLADNSTAVAIGAYLGMLAAALFVWFMGSLRSELGSHEVGEGRLTAIAFGGGVAVGAILLVVYGTLLSAAVRAGADSGIGEVGAATVYDITSTLQGVALGYAMAVVLGAYAVLAFRTRFTSRVMAWITALLALGSISPASYIFLGPAILWVGWVSVTMYLSGNRRAATV